MAVCASPMSQLSTAPGTPCADFLLDPEVPEMPSSPDFQPFKLDRKANRFGSTCSIPEVDSAEEESPGLAPVTHWYLPEPHLKSHLGQWAQTRVETAIPDPQLTSPLGKWAEARIESHIEQPELNSSLGKWAQFVVEELNCGMQLPDPELKSSLGKWAKNQVDQLTFELPEPQLNSQLGQWAQRHVEETPLCVGLPPLQSEIGQRAQRMVAAEMWLKAQMDILADQEEYIVDNRGLFEGTHRLAFRKSKNEDDCEMWIEGPAWGTKVMGTDEGDGWVKVGDLFLPTTLGGVQVLTPKLTPSLQASAGDSDDDDAEPMRDGPALTQDGRVVDLDGGLPIFFASDKVSSAGHSCKVVMMNAAKLAKSTRSASDIAAAAHEVDEEAVCSLDSDGTLYGAQSFSWRSASVAKEASKAAKDRLKAFHQRRQQRQLGEEVACGGVLGIEANGQASLFLYSRPSQQKVGSQETQAGTVLVIDANGTVQETKPRPQERQTETVFVIDANGTVQDW